jgi:redox-sensing transcriptional repressor
MKKNKISNAVIRRLPRYLRHLAAMRREGQERTSSSALGSRMGLTASQIRQDLSCFGEFGQQGYGYNVETLYRELREILYLNQEKDAVLVGVGNLGHALIRNFRFRESGIRLCAAFDADPALVGSSINGVTVEDAAGLSAYLARHPATVAILTLPGRYAQQTAELLMEGGVKGIWNFTGFDVEVPGRFSDVVIESVHFSDSLQVLNYLIGGAERETE